MNLETLVGGHVARESGQRVARQIPRCTAGNETRGGQVSVIHLMHDFRESHAIAEVGGGVSGTAHVVECLELRSSVGVEDRRERHGLYVIESC